VGQRQKGDDGDEGEWQGSDHEGTSIPETAAWVASVSTAPAPVFLFISAVGVSFNMTLRPLHGSSHFLPRPKSNRNPLCFSELPSAGEKRTEGPRVRFLNGGLQNSSGR
jgi:hypothetical protein